MKKKHKVKPNFLIIGAPGTATDSLSTLISLHPEGGIARVYQPSFFSVDAIYKVGWKKYLRLFEHCQGKKAVGEASVAIVAVSPHRGEAFAACRAAIDRLKTTVPIWKKEFHPDGSSDWVDTSRH